MLPFRETKMDKISPSSDHASPTIRAETNSLSASKSDGESHRHHTSKREKSTSEAMDDEDDTPRKQKSAATDDDSVPPKEGASRDQEGKDSGSGEASVKKRTWRKPKDKPKRPLSSYNIFFQHQRERIVEGKPGEASPEEIVQSVEAILSRPPTKRRHRKSHGRISFGDLARTIAESWKSVSPKAKSIFEHYAERDSLRYKRELKVWKDRKDMELEATTLAKHSNFINSMNMSSSMRSEGSTTSEYLDSLPREGNVSQHSSTTYSNHQGRSFSTFNSSMNSVDSINFNLSSHEPDSIQHAFQRQQQILQQQLRMDQNSMNAGGAASAGFGGMGMNPRGIMMMMGSGANNEGHMMAPGSNAFHSSFSSLPARMAISGSGMEAAMARSGFSGNGGGGGGFEGFGGNSRDGNNMGPGGNMPLGTDVDPLLGASSLHGGFGGMQSAATATAAAAAAGRHMRSTNDGLGSGGMMMGSGSVDGGMMGNASFTGGFGHSSQQQQNMMMSPAMMGMMNPQQQQQYPSQQPSGDIDRMQQKLEWLQEQQRRLYMQHQQQGAAGAGMQQFMPMTNTSNHSLQMDSLGSGHIVSDRSHSDHNASYATFASAQTLGYGSHGGRGMSPARSGMTAQQMSYGVGNTDPVMVSMSGSGRGSGAMSISNNSSDRPSADHPAHGGASTSEFMAANQRYMGGNSSSGHNNSGGGGGGGGF